MMTPKPQQESSPWPWTPAQLFAHLDGMEIKYTTYHHAPVFTVAESVAVKTYATGVGCKCLFLKDAKEGRLWLVGTIDDKRVDLKALNEVMGCGRFSFASPEALYEKLGVTPGTVTLFAVVNNKNHDVEVIMDEDFMAATIVNFHPLSNDMTTGINPHDLKAFIEGCGFKPHVVALPAMSR